MACDANTKRISAIAHGADGFDEPVGGSFDESVVHGENRPGTRVSPCIWLESYGLRGRAEWQGWQTPVVRNTKASLVYTLEQIGGGSTTVTLANMRAGSAGGDMNAQPHRQSQEFVYDAGTAENFAPISIA